METIYLGILEQEAQNNSRIANRFFDNRGDSTAGYTQLTNGLKVNINIYTVYLLAFVQWEMTAKRVETTVKRVETTAKSRDYSKE